jgi:hypothetical protein
MKRKGNYRNSEVNFELSWEHNRELLGMKSENYVYGHRDLRITDMAKHFLFVKCKKISILLDLLVYNPIYRYDCQQ